jgi:hypothetical protein
MVAGGFGPYHCLWRSGTQTKRTGANHTPWVTPPALGLGSIHRGGRVVSTPPPNAIMSFFLCMHVVDYFNEYIHIFDTLLINYVPELPPRLRSKRRCCCRPPPCRQPLPPCRPATATVVTAYSAAKTKALDYDDIANDGQGMVVVFFVVVVVVSAATVSPLPLPLMSPSLLSSSSLDRRRPPI